jgi:hypothetical protein
MLILGVIGVIKVSACKFSCTSYKLLNKCENIQRERPRKLFDYFKSLNYSLTWFLMVPPKDGFANMGVVAI